ncbi:hypothetical protein BASA81_003112 [Batrachochytrium salamandrivorans]|nr:hypothetical protein BASA81_003112 [Batrachochytrium salamandrivorans]
MTTRTYCWVGLIVVFGFHLIILSYYRWVRSSRPSALPEIGYLNDYYIDRYSLGKQECQICKYPIAFLPKPKKNFSYLMSFPGSGNNWILNSITSGTRLYPCSVYNETGTPNLFHQCSITKTHYPMYQTKYDQFHTAQSRIFVLRNPFDAIAAEIFRQVEEDANTKYSELDRLAHHFPTTAQRWAEFMKINLGRRFWETATSKGNGLALYRDRDMIVFYEDFKLNAPDLMLELFTFVKRNLGDGMLPTASQAATCAQEYGASAFGRGSLRGRTKQQIFAQSRFQSLTKLACELWKDYWVESRWGKCMDKYQQHFSKDVMGIQAVKKYRPICNGFQRE